MPRISPVAPSVLVLAFAVAPGALAQDWTGMGRLEGRVVDASGKPVEDATVKLDHPARGGGPTVKTDKKGKWAYLGLVAGSWNLDVAAEGYATRQVKVNLPNEGARSRRSKSSSRRPRPRVRRPRSCRHSPRPRRPTRPSVTRKQSPSTRSCSPCVPTSPPPSTSSIGFANIRLRRYEPALAHLQKVLDADPANVQIRGIAAQAALEGGMLDRGLELLKGIDETAIKSPDLFFNIGVNFLNANQPEQAIAYFTKAITVDPGYADGYFRRALAYVQINRIAEARADLGKLLELAPEGASADAARKTLEQLE